MDLTLHQLTVYAAVARARSFTQAAAELRISQPVLSRTVNDIERRLGTRLLRRTTRSVQLTADGAELLKIAEDLLGHYRAGMNRFAAYRAGERGEVTVAALPSIAAALLPGVISAFLAAHPGVRLHILDGTSREVAAHVRRGVADLGVADDAAAGDDLEPEPLHEEPVVAVLPRGHPLAAGESVTWRALTAHPFIAFSRDSSIRRATDVAFAHAGLDPDAVVETRNVATAAGMIAAGLGVTAVPELVLPLMSFAEVTALPLADPAVTRRLVVLTRRRATPPPAAVRFRDHLRHAG